MVVQEHDCLPVAYYCLIQAAKPSSLSRIFLTVIVLERGMAVKVNQQYMNEALTTAQEEVNCLM